MLILDSHLDLSMNALEWNRDLRRPLEEVRRRESQQTDKLDRGKGVITLPEMRRGQIGVCIATQIARYVAEGSTLPGWNSPEIAWAVSQGQLAYYRALEELGEMVQITDRKTFHHYVDLWKKGPSDSLPIAYILSIEGADSLLTPAHVERAYGYGLRAIGPAHYGPGRYAPGTGGDDGLTPAGRELLKQMQQLGMALDVTHLTDRGFREAMELFPGTVWASHNNCRALVPHGRQFTDEQIRALIARDAVIGVAFDAWMLTTGWVRGKSTPEEAGVTIATVVDHIDHICQLAGNVRHCGIGSDLDGGFGREQSPADLGSIADLQNLVPLLAQRGYSTADIEAIMHGNWIRCIDTIWN
jgi:membrane dipeptidase